MSIVDDLIANLIQRNALRLNGSLKIALISGGVLNINAPVDATVRVGDLVIPVPKIP